MLLRDGQGREMMIQRSQIESFEAVARRNFIIFMRNHLTEHFPHHSQILGEEGIGKIIESGIARAANYGVTSERDVCKFIDLQFACGESFDSEETHPWAAAILSDPTFQDSAARMNALIVEAQDHLVSPAPSGLER